MFDSMMMGGRTRSTRVHRPGCPRRRTGFAVLVSVAFLLLPLGCAGRQTPEDVAEEERPLPYQVGVYLDTETLPYDLPQLDENGARIQYLARDEEILQMVEETLAGETPVVTHVVVLEANTKEAALQEAKGLDLLLGIGLDSPEEFTETSYSPAWATLEVATFVFGGFPSWFVPTVS